MLVKKIGKYSPSEDALVKLDQEFEGWVVGLRLVSLAARHVEHPDRLMQQLHGGIRQIQDYLLQEVLSRQSPQLRNWLLKSAVLTRFNEALCNAVCGEKDNQEQSNFNGARMIQALQTGNLFVISLDTQDKWFRYHHLFRQLLQRELKRSASPQAINELYRRASAWCEAKAFTNEAIQYAQQADGMVAAGKIVERHWRNELEHDRWYIVKDWFDLLPQEIIQQRGELRLAELWLTLTQQQFDRLPQLIEQIEAQAKDQPWYPRVSQDLRFFHGLLEYWQGHGKKSLSLLETLMHKIPERLGITAGWIWLYYGLALCMQGQRQQAIKLLNEQLSDPHLPPLYRSQLIGAMAFIHLISGELHQANKYITELIPLAEVHKIANTAAWGNYLLACNELQVNQLDQALHQFEKATSQIYILESKASIDALAGQALTQMLQGQSDDADQTVERIRAFARERNEAECLLVADSCLARLQVLRGELVPAAQWARSVTTASTPQELFTWLEVPALTRVRVLLAIGSAETLQEAAGQLDAIRATSEACRFIGQMIEVEVLQSLLLEKQGHSEEALQCLEQTIAMAVPGGWIRPFIEAGQPMQRLLERRAKQNSVTDQLGIVLDAIVASQQQPIEPVTDEAERGANRETGLTEPLTKREYDILELLANRLQNKEIAAKLFVSPETVKSHLKHLYQKLGVSNRRDAAAKAAAILSSHTATSHRT
jgi:LuxR family maltose regulon positive regulatory protein